MKLLRGPFDVNSWEDQANGNKQENSTNTSETRPGSKIYVFEIIMKPSG